MTTLVPASMTAEGVTAAQVTALQSRATALEALALTNGTAVAAASQTSMDFTGIPATAKRIAVTLKQLSSNGTGNFTVRLGSGSIDAASYTGAVTTLSTGATTSALSTGFDIPNPGASAAFAVSGVLTLTLQSGNIWVASGVFGEIDVARTIVLAGDKTLAGVLDRVRVTTTSGTETFDAGAANVTWD